MIGDGELVAFNVGPDAATYLVVALRPLDHRIERLEGVSFAKTVPEQSQNYRVAGLSGAHDCLTISVPRQYLRN